MITSINPATGEILGQIMPSTEAEIKAKVAAAKAAQTQWAALTLDARIKILRGLNTAFEKHADALAEITSLEMGQVIGLSKPLIEGAIAQFNWNLDNAPAILKNDITYEDAHEINEAVYEPRGVVACIMAWNFPLSNFVWSVSQSLIAGNAVVLKYSEEIPLFSKKLEEICNIAGLPDGILAFVYGDGQTGSFLAEQDIDFICFTGSTQTGQKLHFKAAEKGIGILMELGGSSPGVVFADADLDATIDMIFDLRFGNTGQFCSNLKRLIVHSSLYDRCVDALKNIAIGKTIANPLNADTDFGPLVAERQVIRLEGQIQDAIQKGAKVVCGGKRPVGLNGAYYEPTILTNITKDMRVWTEETFGPVLPVIPFETYEEAITLANDSIYGLTGYVFTTDTTLARRAAVDIKAGCIGVNNIHFYRPVNFFGGYKHSGLGRENGKWGFHEICQVKIIAREKDKT